jgi:hypothetical protein
VVGPAHKPTLVVGPPGGARIERALIYDHGWGHTSVHGPTSDVPHPHSHLRGDDSVILHYIVVGPAHKPTLVVGPSGGARIERALSYDHGWGHTSVHGPTSDVPHPHSHLRGDDTVSYILLWSDPLINRPLWSGPQGVLGLSGPSSMTTGGSTLASTDQLVCLFHPQGSTYWCPSDQLVRSSPANTLSTIRAREILKPNG